MARQLEFHPGGIPTSYEGVYVCEESPPCCTPCSSCLDGVTPRYWRVTISGLVDANPTDCNACNRYDATYTLRRADSTHGEDGFGGFCPSGSNSSDRCCWVCIVRTNQFDCSAYSNLAPNAIGLAVTTVAGVKKIMVNLQSVFGETIFEKTYPGSIDCRNISGDTLTHVSSSQCDGSGATVTITSVEEIDEPCCRGFCYPDETPGPITVVVAGLSNLGGGEDCTDCPSLNGTYICTRKLTHVYGDETNGCWIGSFPETCGMDRISVGPGLDEVRFYNSTSYPFGSSIGFGTTHYFPFSSYFTPPYANCTQFDGMEFRTSGDGYCSVGGAFPTFYGTATISF